MDPVALHRKLEPIYEMIDGGNNKAALKSIDRELLSKFPAMQIGRVLKGIVLQRMGRDDEGMDLCESVRLEGPRDDTVLHTLSLFYKNTGRTEQTVAMFEAAAEAQPRNPEYLRSLFQSYARGGAFVKQQTCAMKLYRLSNDPKHVMWAVCGALLQTRDGDASAGDPTPVLMSLAGFGTFLAIVFHKPFDALTITAIMRVTGSSRGRIVLVNILFALVIPLGIGLFFFIAFWWFFFIRFFVIIAGTPSLNLGSQTRRIPHVIIIDYVVLPFISGNSFLFRI